MSNFDSIKYSNNHFSSHEFAPKPPKRRRKWKWLVLLVLLAVLGITTYRYISKTNQIFTGNQNILQRLGGIFLSSDKQLIGEETGTVNILLMGIGGDGHEGSRLTDTMMVASINTKTNEVILTSIPRDFALELDKIGYNRINAAYAYAYKEDPDTAGDMAIAAVEKITGFKIPYYAVIDFKGFVEAVNHVGGLDINVERTFTDATFPNDYPYDTTGYLAPVTFNKGKEHMDGKRALIFARSRHSNDYIEGSDFARSERQKKILIAMKEKVLALNLGQVGTINNLLSDFTENFRTNFEPYELKRLADLAKNIGNEKIYSLSLEPDGVLICSALVDPQTGKRIPPPPVPAPLPPPTPTPTPKPTPNPAPTPAPVTEEEEKEPEVIRMYVIQPCEGKTLADIHAWLNNSSELAKLRKEAAVVEIQNSTGKSAATTKYRILSEKGMNLKFATFLGKVGYEKTILYDNSHGSKPNTLEYLKKNYNLTISDVNYTSSTADFVIILGSDSL